MQLGHEKRAHAVITLQLPCVPLCEASAADGDKRWPYLVLHNLRRDICLCVLHVSYMYASPCACAHMSGDEIRILGVCFAALRRGLLLSQKLAFQGRLPSEPSGSTRLCSSIVSCRHMQLCLDFYMVLGI